MYNFDQLNDQYVKLNETLPLLMKFKNKITSDSDLRGLSSYNKVVIMQKLLNAFSQILDADMYQRFKDTRGICDSYFSCMKEIDSYKQQMLDSNPDSPALNESISRASALQLSFSTQKKEYFEKYHMPVNNGDDMVAVAEASIDEAISVTRQAIDDLKRQARDIVNQDFGVRLRMNDPVNQLDNLPGNFAVARYPIMKVTQQILRDIGVTSILEPITTSMRYQGNTIISVPFEHLRDKEIDEFIIAYIMKFINEFPLGSVNVHIFDQNKSKLYLRLFNAFQADNSGENTKRTVQINPAGGLAKFRDVNCNDITKKLKAGEDLYDLYENDHTDPFNLIIMRDGLSSSGLGNGLDKLQLLSSLTNPDETGHICGLRFLLVDYSQSQNLNEHAPYLINEIKEHCDIKIQYDAGTFVVNDRESQVLNVDGNLDSYVQDRAAMIADLINKQEKNIVTLHDVACKEYGMHAESILHIPVGKTGTEIVELPISCRNDDQTLEGQCTGYMVIGLSGSGKSSFFHSMVINGCIKYSPKDLQFWLLDFKDGGASSKYSNSGLPHIKLIARDNKIDDALCLFRMAREEQERRNKLFNANGVDNIIDYNRIANEKNLEYLPRIIIAIDEVQEIFRDENSSVIRDLISSSSARMRSSGMHFVMIAQNLAQGKAYMLKESFMSNVTGRVCFHVTSGIPKDSGYEDEFVERKDEIEDLKTGEAYVSYGKGTIRKVKIAYITTQEMNESIFEDIRNHYPEYSDQKPLVIGQKDRLSINAAWQGRTDIGYYNLIRYPSSTNDSYSACIGEESYQMKPINFRFSSNDNSSLLFVGSDKQIASSLCASVAFSLLHQNVKIHLFNGDKTKVSSESGTVPHPFMYVCQNASNFGELVQNHMLGDLPDVLKDIYAKFIERRSILQNTDELENPFDPIFLIVNDLYSIESYVSNVQIKSEGQQREKTDRFDHSIQLSGFGSLPFESVKSSAGFSQDAQSIMASILESGYKYNIFAAISIRDIGSNIRNQRILSTVSNLVIFNTVSDLSSFSINSPVSYLREMMMHIQNEPEETMAVSIIKQNISKIRPIIYKLDNQRELEAVDSLLKGA